MDIECPYCNQGFNIDHDDGSYYEEDRDHQIQCSHCEKTFVFQTEVQYNYKAYPANCLNDDSEHDWKLTNTHPKSFSKMQCGMCSTRRELTEEERGEYGIEHYSTTIRFC